MEANFRLPLEAVKDLQSTPRGGGSFGAVLYNFNRPRRILQPWVLRALRTAASADWPFAAGKTAVVALLSTATLSACTTVGPNYNLPAQALINAPAAQGAFVGAGGKAVVQAPLPDHWWRLYQSPDLDRLITEAFAANTDLRVAEANLERSRALVKEAEAARQPDVAFGASAARAQLSAEQYLETAQLPQFNLYEVDITASYQLDLFGGIRRGVEAAKADDEAVEAARDLVRVTVAGEVAKAYVDVCSAGDQLAAARASLALQQQSLALTQRLAKGGRATRLDLTRSQGQIDQFRANIPALEAARRNALYRLATLTGNPPAAFEADLTRCVSAPVLAQPIPVGDGAALLKRRPDVRAAERRLAARTAEIGVATAALYPDITLGASIGSTGVIGDFLKPATNDYSIGPGISWDLNHSAARARIKAAKAGQAAELARFDGVVLTALRDVEIALNVYAHDLERQTSLTAARDQAASALADAHRLQAAGRSGSLATLDAERALATTQSALAAVRAQIADDQVALFLALGGGWETGAA
jgi:NodT family efflux transporter outer membrane factor (OMF) lipoprotein